MGASPLVTLLPTKLTKSPTATITNDYAAGSPPGEKAFAASDSSSIKGALFVGGYEQEDDVTPTEEERSTLRLVSDKIPVAAYHIALVEFGEYPPAHPRRRRY